MLREVDERGVVSWVPLLIVVEKILIEEERDPVVLLRLIIDVRFGISP